MVLAAHLGKEIHKDSLEGVEWNRFNQDNSLILVVVLLLLGGGGVEKSTSGVFPFFFLQPGSVFYFFLFY